MLLGNSLLVIWGSILILNFTNPSAKLVSSCGTRVLPGSYSESHSQVILDSRSCFCDHPGEAHLIRSTDTPGFKPFTKF